MADAYSSGGGGGISRVVTENTRYGLDKPYDFDSGWGPDQIGQLNEMLTYLFRNVGKGENNHLDLEETVTNLITTVSGLGGESSDILLSSTAITEPQLETLNSSRVEIIAAPGAGKVLWLLQLYVVVSITVGGYSGVRSFNARYNGSSTDVASTNTADFSAIATLFMGSNTLSQTFSTAAGGFNPENKSIKLGYSTGDLGNPGTGSGTAKAYAVYSILDV